MVDDLIQLIKAPVLLPWTRTLRCRIRLGFQVPWARRFLRLERTARRNFRTYVHERRPFWRDSVKCFRQQRLLYGVNFRILSRKVRSHRAKKGHSVVRAELKKFLGRERERERGGGGNTHTKTKSQQKLFKANPRCNLCSAGTNQLSLSLALSL